MKEVAMDVTTNNGRDRWAVRGGGFFLALLTLAVAACIRIVTDDPDRDLAVPEAGSPPVSLMQAEIASVVIPPGANAACPNGMLVVTWARYARQFAMRADLSCLGEAGCSQGLNEEESANLPVPADTVTFSAVPQPEGGTCTPDFVRPKYRGNMGDVALARLPNGEIAQLGLGWRMRDAQWPNCDQVTKDVDTLIMRVSSDCGATWPQDRVRTIDADDVIMPLGDGGTHPANLLDRPEMYHEPVTGTLYVSVKVRYDSDPGTIEVESFKGIVFASTDLGRSWRQIPLNDEWTPFVMTSSPTGRLYLFHCVGPLPILGWVEPEGQYEEQALGTVVPREHGCSIVHSFYDELPGRLHNIINQVGISLAASLRPPPPLPRVDTLRVVWPHKGQAWEGGPSRQEARVATVTVTERRLSVDDVRSLVARNPADSVLHMTLIEPERARVDPRNALDGTALLTWLETDSTALPMRIHQKAQVAVGRAWMETRDLTVESGDASPWIPNLDCGPTPTGLIDCWIGDYHYGAFIDQQPDRTRLRLVAVWPESDPALADAGPNLQVHANIVTVAEQLP
jgi:hypothetical protein